jgi:hypothetical protein
MRHEFRWFDVVVATTFLCWGMVLNDAAKPPLALTLPLATCLGLVLFYGLIQNYLNLPLKAWVAAEIYLFLITMGGVIVISQITSQITADHSFIYLEAFGVEPFAKDEFRLVAINSAKYPFRNVSVRFNRLDPIPTADAWNYPPFDIGDLDKRFTELHLPFLLPKGVWSININSGEQNFIETLDMYAGRIILKRFGESKVLFDTNSPR